MLLTPESHFSLDWRSSVAICITLVVSAFANASGIGGGAFFVPLFNVLVGFGLKTSTALSQAVITAGVLSGVTLNARRHHPKDLELCIIDFDLVLLFTPVLLLGVNTGVLFNVMFPDWLITILLIALIAYLTMKTCQKGRGMWKAETRKKLDTFSSPPSSPGGSPTAELQRRTPSDLLPQPQRRRMAVPMGLLGRSLDPFDSSTSLPSQAGSITPPATMVYFRGSSSIHPEPPVPPRASSDHHPPLPAPQGEPLEPPAPAMGLLGGSENPPAPPLTPQPQALRAASLSKSQSVEMQRSGSAAAAELVASQPAPPLPATGRDDGRCDPAQALAGAHEEGAHAHAHGGHVREPADAHPSTSASSRLGAHTSAGPAAQLDEAEPWIARTPGIAEGPAARLRQHSLPISKYLVLEDDQGKDQDDGDAGRGRIDSVQLSDSSDLHPVPFPTGMQGVQVVTPSAWDSPTDTLLPSQPHIKYPWTLLGTLVLLWTTFALLQFGKSRVPRCAGAYWGVFATQVALMLMSSLAITWHVLRVGRKLTPDEPQDEMDVQQPRLVPTWRSLVWCQLLTLLAGIIGGLTGLGGGMIIAPLLLELGVEPQVSASTTSVMVLFSSSMAALQFLLLSKLNLQYAAVFGAAAIVAGFAGVTLVNRAVQQTGRTSIIVITLATVIGAGGVVLAAFGIKKAAFDLESHHNVGFKDFCTQ